MSAFFVFPLRQRWAVQCQRGYSVGRKSVKLPICSLTLFWALSLLPPLSLYSLQGRRAPLVLLRLLRLPRPNHLRMARLVHGNLPYGFSLLLSRRPESSNQTQESNTARAIRRHLSLTPVFSRDPRTLSLFFLWSYELSIPGLKINLTAYIFSAILVLSLMAG